MFTIPPSWMMCGYFILPTKCAIKTNCMIFIHDTAATSNKFLILQHLQHLSKDVWAISKTLPILQQIIVWALCLNFCIQNLINIVCHVCTVNVLPQQTHFRHWLDCSPWSHGYLQYLHGVWCVCEYYNWYILKMKNDYLIASLVFILFVGVDQVLF